MPLKLSSTERLVKSVGHVEPSDVSVARPAEVIGLDVMIAHAADRRRPGDEIVLVVMAARAIEVGVKAQLRRVTLREKILSENIRNQDLLIARVELVQVRVGVLLEHVESGEIVLPAVVVVVAENARAEIGVVEDEPAKIAHERLDAETRRNEIVVVREIANVNFAERFLERRPIFIARRVLQSWIGIEHTRFLNVGVVAVVNAEKTYRPRNRFERGFALEQIDADRKVVRDK